MDIGRPGGYYEGNFSVPRNNQYDEQRKYSEYLEPVFEKMGLTAEGIERLRKILLDRFGSLNQIAVEAGQDPERTMQTLGYFAEKADLYRDYGAVAEDGSDAYKYSPEMQDGSSVRKGLFEREPRQRIPGSKWGR